MDAVHRFSRPNLRRPVAVIAFEGWNDASDAASSAAAYLLGEADEPEPFAAIDPEEFFDFQAHRPQVEIGDGGTRRLTWPHTRFFAVPQPAAERDLVVVLGEEPSFRWKTFSRHLTMVLDEVGVEDAVLLGAFIGQVPHTRPTPVIGVATDPDLVLTNDIPTSTYEGPTGIVGVLIEACRETGLRAVSLWAAVPHYLAANPNPKATLALLEHAQAYANLSVDLGDLRGYAADFNQRVDEAVRESGEFSEYVMSLEDDEVGLVVPMDDDLEGTDPDSLVNEIEAFLRDQP